MKASKTKIKRLRHTYMVLRKLEQRIFDVFSKTLMELDQAMLSVEQGLKKAWKGRLR